MRLQVTAVPIFLPAWELRLDDMSWFSFWDHTRELRAPGPEDSSGLFPYAPHNRVVLTYSRLTEARYGPHKLVLVPGWSKTLKVSG